MATANGLGDATPVSMADTLKAHAEHEHCPKHPIAALWKQKNAAYAERDRLVAALSELFPRPMPHPPTATRPGTTTGTGSSQSSSHRAGGAAHQRLGVALVRLPSTAAGKAEQLERLHRPATCRRCSGYDFQPWSDRRGPPPETIRARDEVGCTQISPLFQGCSCWERSDESGSRYGSRVGELPTCTQS